MMAKGKVSHLLVIDASIARAAGETDHPVSSSCRKTLESILDICHRIVLTRDIRNEWKKHESRYARKWLSAMFSRRKVVLKSETSIDISPENVKSIDKKGREILQKDALLIEGALIGDGIIISLDKEVALVWEKHHDKFNLPKEITWINPLTQDKL